MLGFGPIAAAPIAASLGEGIDAVITGAVAATGQVGSVTVTTGTGVSPTITGLPSTASLGIVSVTTTELTAGWNRSFWGSGRWGTPVTIADVAGVTATAQVGAVTATGTVSVDANVTGVSSTGQVGSVTALAGNAVGVVGVSANASVGAISSVTGTASVIPTGVSGTAVVGSNTIVPGAGTNVFVTGVAGTGAIGTATVVADAVVSVTGVSSTASVGSVTASGDSSVTLVGVRGTGIANSIPINVSVLVLSTDAAGWGRDVWNAGAWGSAVTQDLGMTASLGTATVVPRIIANVTGLSSTATVGSVTVTAGTGITVPVTGVNASCELGPRGVTVWGRVVPSGTTTWTNIAPSTTTTYTEIRP